MRGHGRYRLQKKVGDARVTALICRIYWRRLPEGVGKRRGSHERTHTFLDEFRNYEDATSGIAETKSYAIFANGWS